MEQQLTQREWDIAIETAEYSGRKYPGVDPEEVLGEIGEWIARNWPKVLAWRELDYGLGVYKKALRDAAIDASRRIYDLEKGADPDSSYRYKSAELRALIPYAIEDDWYHGKTDAVNNGIRGTVDPSKVNSWQESMMDVRDAFFSLSAKGQGLLRHGAAVAWDWDKLAVRLSYGNPESAQRAVNKHLEKMRRYLGSSAQRIYGEYVGTRNNPEYSYDARAEECALIDEVMS